jgi:hypothetical protein
MPTDLYVGPPAEEPPTVADLKAMRKLRGVVPDSIAVHHEAAATEPAFAASAVLVQDFAGAQWRPEVTPATEALIAEAVRRG